MSTQFKHNSAIYIAAALVCSVLPGLIAAAWAAGRPSADIPDSQPGADKRRQANVHFRQGEAHADQMRYQEAARAYERAIEIDGSYAEAYSNLGYSYRKQGLFDKAVAAYKLAIALDPELAEAYEYLGEAYAEMKQFDLAEAQLKVLKRLDPEEARELESFIEKMKP